jgi:hypothetical protein
MKINIIYALVSCCIFTFVACEDNIEDATSKHVYSENESPYLKGNADATVTTDVEFDIRRPETLTVSLEDYAEKFQKQLGMTVDEAINGLSNGSVVFYNIRVSRNNWDKTAMTKGSTGWYYNSAGGVAGESEKQVVSLDLDKENKTLIVNTASQAEAGVTPTLNVGFALDGPDYDEYVRFSFNVAITDPAIIIANINIPDGDYAAANIDFNEYTEKIEYNMGLSVEDFLANLDINEGKTIHMYFINVKTGEWDTISDYTANPPGYWIKWDENTEDSEVCSWGNDGFSLYAETDINNQTLNIGRAPDKESGNKYTISIGFKDTTDETKFFRFIITATLQ